MLKRLKFVVEQWVLFMVRRQTWQARRFEISNRPVTFESNRIWTSDSNSNRIWKLRRSLSNCYIRCLWACIFSGHWDIVKARNGQKSNFYRTFGPSCRNPLAKVAGSMPECAQVCALHMRPQSTALGDANENRNGRRKPQNWYYVTHFLAHPIEPRDRWSKHMRHLDRGEIKLFSYAAYMPLVRFCC